MLGKDFEMKKKLFSFGLAVMMCLSFTIGIAANDIEEHGGINCCSDHIVSFTYYNAEPVSMDFSFMATSTCTHRFVNSYLVDRNRIFVNTHWVPISGGVGPTVECSVYRVEVWRVNVCNDICKSLLGQSHWSNAIRHSHTHS
jgi:hypothetical protein